MRRAAKVDINQVEVVKALRSAGATVQILSTIGQGCPDLLVGWRGINMLMEVKDGNLPPSHRNLTADEKQWHGTWGGQVAVVDSAPEAVRQLVETGKMFGVI